MIYKDILEAVGKEAGKRKDSGYTDSGYRREIFFNGIIQGWGKLRFPHP